MGHRAGNEGADASRVEGDDACSPGRRRITTTRRAVLLVLGGGLLPTVTFGQQQPPKLARIGFLGAASAASYGNELQALRQGLREAGYVEGRNLAIELRLADEKYDRLPELAAELVRLGVDIILADSTTATVAARRATTTTPIVMIKTGDAIASGVVASLARPGGNVTGLTFFSLDLEQKRLELLKEVVPRIARVAILHNPGAASTKPAFEAMTAAAKILKLGLEPVEVRGHDEFERAFKAMAARRVDAVVIRQDPVLTLNPGVIADLAAAQRLPSVGNREFGEAGGLIGYGVNFLEMYRRSAHYVDRILKGAKAGDLPIERATKFELVVNVKTAKALGITIPQPFLMRADRVIE